MIEIKATHRAPIKLGHTGENEAVRVAFSLLPFKETFPDGVPALLARRKGDAAAYPVPLTIEADTAYWSVTRADTEKAGFGQCELQWIVGNTLAKSDKFDFFVVKALEAGAEAPDAPSKAWFEAIQGQIGDLSKLTTKEKENLVAAINEAARTGGGSGGGTIEMRVSGGYIQYSSDGATWENLIAVEDLKGEAGPQGIPGEKGEAGPQGPRGETGPQGEKGLKGDTGPQGIPGEKGADGAAGKDGSDGYSPEATVTPINGGAKIIIKDRNGTTSANVMNGAQGPKGDKGDPGATDLSLGITGATPGQIAKITAVDTSGQPTAWEPVDMAGGGSGGLTDAQIAALDGLFKIASYQQDSSAAYEAFKQAFGIADGVIVFAADFSGRSPSAAQFYSWAGRVYGSAIYDALTNIQCVDGAVKLTSVYDSTNSRWVKQMMCTGGLFEADEFICTFKAKFCGTAGSWNSVITYGAGTHWTDGLYSDGIKWPAGGEIDAFEQAGGYAENPNTFKTPTAHWGSGRNSQYPDTHLSRTGESVAFTPDVWHNFKFSLKSGTVRIYIDDTLVGEKDFSDCAVSNNYLADYKPFLKPQAFYIDGSCADTSDTSNSYLFEVKDFAVHQDADVACTGLAIHPQMWDSGTTLVFPAGAEIYFDRVYTPANTSNKACVWESTNEDVATVEQGYVKTLATGTTVIRATCGGITATYTLTVAASASIPCAKLACAQESIIANAGNAIALNVYKYPSFTTDEITVTSGSQDVCTVSGTIVTAVGAGSTEITIQCGTKSVTIPVTVSAAKSPYVAYDFAELAANIGQPRTDENASVAVANTGTAGAAFDLIATATTKDVVVDNAWVTQINYYTAQNSPLETALNLRAQPFLYVAEVRENNGAIYLNGTNLNVMPSIACKTNVCNIRYGPAALFEYTPVTPPYVVAIYFDGAKTSVFANAAKIASDGSYDYITDALKYFRFWGAERFNAFKLYVGDTFTDDEIIALTEAQNE